MTQKSPSAHHRTTLSGYIFATKAHIDNRNKNLFSSNISFRGLHNMVNFGPFAAEIGLVVGAPQLISTGFASWQRYCTVLQQWTSAKLCGVEQRAPPIFGRAAITLGIGPHSSSSSFNKQLTKRNLYNGNHTIPLFYGHYTVRPALAGTPS